MNTTTLQKYDCDRCGFTYKKTQLKRQRGLLLCCDCRDDLKKIKQPNPRWMSPRDNSLTTTPVNAPTVYTISAATGIDALRQSRDYDHEGGRRQFHMYIVSDGGAVDITADPQIVSGLHGDILTLHGTSNTDTIKFEDTRALHMNGGRPVTLHDGDTITFVYNEDGTYLRGWGYFYWGDGQGYDTLSSGWVETSRNKGGI